MVSSDQLVYPNVTQSISCRFCLYGPSEQGIWYEGRNITELRS